MKTHRSSKWLTILSRVVCSFAITILAFGWVTRNGSSPGIAQASGECTEWDLASDYVYPYQQNPGPDSCGTPDVWYFMRSDINRQTYTLLNIYQNDIWGIPGIQGWWNNYPGQQPIVAINASGQDRQQDIEYWPAGAVNAHPLWDQDAVVAWHSPIDGFVAVNGSVSDMNAAYGNGIRWFIEKNNSNLVSGSIEEGGAQSFIDGTGGNLLENIQVQKGDFLYFAIDPKEYNYVCDATILNIHITTTSAPSGILFYGQTQKGAAGQTVNYQATLTNWTGGDDSFNLSLRGNSWPASLSPAVLGPIGNGQSINFTLSVTIPQDIPAGATDSVQVTATSVNDPTVSKTAVFTTVAENPPVADFYTWLPNPNRFDTIQFINSSSDPEGAGIQSVDWNFGDGTTASGEYPMHRFMADGDYTVQLTATTIDGRIGTISRVIQVRSHDVGIIKFIAPDTAIAGRSMKITVGVENSMYPETVQVILYRSTPWNTYEYVGEMTLDVPKMDLGATKNFTFNYTFSNEDATFGKVTFRAVAIVLNARDALPGDNESISLRTIVKPR